MVCEVCNKDEDCLEKALDIIKKHYSYYENALKQRDVELQQVNERNKKLDIALRLLQQNQQPSKRFKSLNSEDSWLKHTSSQEGQGTSDLSLTDDEQMGASNLNIALNSEQLFDTSAFSQTRNDVGITSSSEMVKSPRVKEYPKKCKQTKGLERSKSEWHKKDRCSPVEKSWAMQFLQHTKEKVSEEKTKDKRICLSLKKTNPSKIKQSLLTFNKPKENCLRESNAGDEVIDDSPVLVKKNSKASRSWAQRSGNNYNISSNHTSSESNKKDDTNKTLDQIVFDFSPTKKKDSKLNPSTIKSMEFKQLNFDSDIPKDCISLPNDNSTNLTNKSDSSSVVILTPGTQDIIFLDDSFNVEPEIDTIDLLADIMKQDNTLNLQKLKQYESKCIDNQHKNQEVDLFKKPQTDFKINTLAGVKPEKITQQNSEEKENKKEAEKKQLFCSRSSSNRQIELTKPQNPLFSFNEHDTEDDENFMPKPYMVKLEPERSPATKKNSIKQRFNIDCEDCEKLIRFLDAGLTDAQIQEHLDKCKRHNNPEIMRQNTPQDFWNPFILSFQADDPRNEVLIDDRFKDNKN